MNHLDDRGVVDGEIDLVMLMGRPTTQTLLLKISQERNHLCNLDVYAIIIHVLKLIIE